jgi:phosphoglycerate dehydrogenase-like enzyme
VPPRHELHGCPIGVIGASRIGRAYISMVVRLGAQVRVFDPHLSRSEAAILGAHYSEFDDLLRHSQIVSLHAPALPNTREIIGKRELALLPDGAGLVNTARAWLVDTEALLAELRSGRIDAALDVFDTEPLPATDPLRGLPNVLLTPHVAAATVEAYRGAGEIVVAEIARFARQDRLHHEVTVDMLSRIA